MKPLCQCVHESFLPNPNLQALNSPDAPGQIEGMEGGAMWQGGNLCLCGVACCFAFLGVVCCDRHMGLAMDVFRGHVWFFMVHS